MTIQHRKGRGRAGVTLIEMLVVVSIIALFAALVGPKVVGWLDKARITAAHDQIRTFKTALVSYKIEAGTFPTTDQGVVRSARPIDGPEHHRS
jgi:general secretion pathway protein G